MNVQLPACYHKQVFQMLHLSHVCISILHLQCHHKFMVNASSTINSNSNFYLKLLKFVGSAYLTVRMLFNDMIWPPVSVSKETKLFTFTQQLRDCSEILNTFWPLPCTKCSTWKSVAYQPTDSSSDLHITCYMVSELFFTSVVLLASFCIVEAFWQVNVFYDMTIWINGPNQNCKIWLS